jgi:uncharacterized protein
LPDALRAVALIGVLVVNALGYHDTPSSRLLGEVVPADSATARVVVGFVAAFVQGKAYPVLSLLFGMGLAYAARGLGHQEAAQRARRRAQRLLVLGLAHGLLLYFGDILTLYALVALSLAGHEREPWHALRRRIARAAGWAALAWLASVVVVALQGRSVDEATLGSVPGVVAFVELNASLYAASQLSALLFAWPLVRLLMLLGIAAARLRLLTHARWAGSRCRLARRALWPVLGLNAAYGALYAAGADDKWGFTLEVASALWSLPLAALYVVAAARAWLRGRRRWGLALAPLGQRTLTLYVAASLVSVLLFSGAGLGLRPSTMQWVGCSLVLWMSAWAWARCSTGRGPLEAWMARR